MTSTTVLYIILGILIADFILERFLEFLNQKKMVAKFAKDTRRYLRSRKI